MGDIYSRMKQVERKLQFLMDNMRMKAAIGSGVLDANGNPSFRTFEGSLEELYQLSRQAATLTEADIDPTAAGVNPPAEEAAN